MCGNAIIMEVDEFEKKEKVLVKEKKKKKSVEDESIEAEKVIPELLMEVVK